MYLILRASLEGVAFASLDDEGSIMALNTWEHHDWDALSARKLKDILQRELKIQGRVFQAVGYVLPFGDGRNESPCQAHIGLFKSLAHSALEEALLKPSRLLVDAAQMLWPHLPHYFLFDTFLSSQLPKHVMLSGMPYETVEKFHFTPRLVESYGHKANSLMVRDSQKFISLFIDRNVSVALFDGSILRDALVSYSPLSPLSGFQNIGAADMGGAFTLFEQLQPKERVRFLVSETGVSPQLDHDFGFEESLQIAGLVERKDLAFMDKLEIERIEWTELTMKSFVRSIRQALAGMLATDHTIKTLVVNTSVIPQKSGFWPLLTEGSLCQLKIVFSDLSALQPAGADLMAAHHG